jgi:hypothetical protein
VLPVRHEVGPRPVHRELEPRRERHPAPHRNHDQERRPPLARHQEVEGHRQRHQRQHRVAPERRQVAHGLLDEGRAQGVGRVPRHPQRQEHRPVPGRRALARHEDRQKPQERGQHEDEGRHGLVEAGADGGGGGHGRLPGRKSKGGRVPP